MYYAMRFIDGLRDGIKSMVMIQCPTTLDSACALALVQEEALDTGKKEVRRYEPFSHWQVHKSAYPLPVPPKLDKPPVSSTVEVSMQLKQHMQVLLTTRCGLYVSTVALEDCVTNTQKMVIWPQVCSHSTIARYTRVMGALS
jgi:hypothetical protein